MKKVFKVTTILAALLLTSVVAVEMLFADHGRTHRPVQVQADKAYVGNEAPAITSVLVTVTDDDLSGTASTTVVVIDNITTATTTDRISINAEVTSDDGVFTVEFFVHPSSTNSTTPTVAASHLDHIEVRYRDNVGNIRKVRAPNTDLPYVIVDAEGPNITNEAPADDFRTNNLAPTVQVDVTDGDSGLGTIPAVPGNKAQVEANSEFKVDGIGGLPLATELGSGNWTLSLVAGFPDPGTVGEVAHTWQVTVKDAVGNKTDSDLFDIIADRSPPTFAAVTAVDHAVTGDTFDADNNVPEDTDNRKSIRLVFTDAVVGASIETDGSDFRVQLVQGGTALAVAGASHDADLNAEVFVTMVSDLPPDAEPLVTIIGSILDEAGNQNTAGDSVTTADGLPPALTAALTVDAAAGTLTNDKITVRVSSDESAADPVAAFTSNIGLAVRKTMADGSVTMSSALVGGTRTIVAAGTQWEWEFTFDDADPQLDEGTYNVYARVEDRDGNAGVAGVEGGAASDDMILFEVDRGIPAPVLDFSNDDPGTFVNVDFGDEGLTTNEYDGDTHDTVSAVTAAVDGVSVVVDTIDSITYTIAAPSGGWSNAKHDLDVTATDDAGNTVSFSDLEFEIVARAEYSISLRPGLNLISLPGLPSSVDINDMIDATHAINQVFTYDPSKAGGWLVAERGDDGLFAGTLTWISSDLAYFVRTDTFDLLEVLIPRISPVERLLPPSLNLKEGWNLVPVIDASGDLTTTDIDASTYFTTVSAVRVYSLNVFGQLVVLDHTGKLTMNDPSDDNVTLGRGYWVYVTSDSTLIP